MTIKPGQSVVFLGNAITSPLYTLHQTSYDAPNMPPNGYVLPTIFASGAPTDKTTNVLAQLAVRCLARNPDLVSIMLDPATDASYAANIATIQAQITAARPACQIAVGGPALTAAAIAASS